MITFTIELAGVRIGIATNFERTQALCRDYLTDGEPEFEVRINRDDILYEMERSVCESLREGLTPQRYPNSYLESLAVYRKIVERLLEYDIFLFHGSVVAVDGEGYLFTAQSGTGKSTHTSLWRQHFGQRAVMVNDDKPLLRVRGGCVEVCGTPWDGKHRLSTNITVPLKAICILRRGTENSIRPVSMQEALPMLLQQSQRPKDPVKMTKFLGLMEKAAKSVGLYFLECNMDPEAAVVAYNGMNGKE